MNATTEIPQNNLLRIEVFSDNKPGHNKDNISNTFRQILLDIASKSTDSESEDAERTAQFLERTIVIIHHADVIGPLKPKRKIKIDEDFSRGLIVDIVYTNVTFKYVLELKEAILKKLAHASISIQSRPINLIHSK